MPKFKVLIFLFLRRTIDFVLHEKEQIVPKMEQQ